MTSVGTLNCEVVTF